MIRVLIADDQPLMRQGFRLILAAQDDIAVVAEAGDGREAVEQARASQPDVVLMDIRMPGLDGIEATRRLPGAKVLILTTFGHDDYVAGALRAGASGFLLKDSTPEELVHAVRVVAGGEAMLAPAVTTRLVAQFVAAAPTPSTRPADVATLTDRELDVFLLIAAGRSNAEIADRLFISENTVKTHISHVFSKLDLKDRVQAVLLALDCGLLDQARRR
jgi:DNA-binding NarL/FixJ family response regulator